MRIRYKARYDQKEYCCALLISKNKQRGHIWLWDANSCLTMLDNVSKAFFKIADNYSLHTINLCLNACQVYFIKTKKHQFLMNHIHSEYDKTFLKMCVELV